MFTIENLTVAYLKGPVALLPTSLTLPAGGFTVLLGASGAGKSTMLRCLNGLVRPTAGRVLAAPLGDIGPALRVHRRRTGMVFQQHHLIGRVSVLGNVLTGRLGHRPAWRSLLPMPRADREMALRALDRVGLLALALRRADSLSGGQQQRVGIARAVAMDPKILLLDEITSALDPELVNEVLDVVRQLASDGMTMLIVTHEIAFARDASHRIVFVADGVVSAQGKPDALMGEVAHNERLRNFLSRFSATAH